MAFDLNKFVTEYIDGSCKRIKKHKGGHFDLFSDLDQDIPRNFHRPTTLSTHYGEEGIRGAPQPAWPCVMWRVVSCVHPGRSLLAPRASLVFLLRAPAVHDSMSAYGVRGGNCCYYSLP